MVCHMVLPYFDEPPGHALLYNGEGLEKNPDWNILCQTLILKICCTVLSTNRGIHKKGSGDVVSAVCVQRDR